MSNFIDNLIGIVRKPVPPTKTAGVGGATIYGGFLQTREKNARLSGRQRYITYSDLLANVSIISAGTRYYLNLLAKAGWSVEPAEDSGARGEEIADLVKQILLEDLNTPWNRVVRRSGMYRFYGFSVQEWTAIRREDGLIGFRDIEARPQKTIERWDTDDNGDVIGIVQRSPQNQDEIYLPRGKVVYIVDDTLDDTPEGLGLFRHTAEPARQLQRFEQLEGWGFETDLRGVPVGRGPFTALQELVDTGKITEATKTAIEKPLKDFVENHVKSPTQGAYLDSITYQSRDDKATPSSIPQWSLELLKGGATSLPEIANAIERKSREIARILGVESLLLGESGAGSLAMARDKSKSFALIVDSGLVELAESYDKDLLDPLFRLNGWDLDLKPTLKPDKIQHRDVEELTRALEELSRAGAPLMPGDEAELEIYDLLGLTRPDRTNIVLDGDLGGPLPPTDGKDLNETPDPDPDPDEE